MLPLASLLIRAVYVLLPLLSLVPFFRRSLNRSHQHSSRALRGAIAGAWVTGVILGGCVAAGYALAMGGYAPPLQAGLACYFGVSLMLLLKLIDFGSLQLPLCRIYAGWGR